MANTGERSNDHAEQRIWYSSAPILHGMIKRLLNDGDDPGTVRSKFFVSLWLLPLIYLRDHKGLVLSNIILLEHLSLNDVGKLAGRCDIPEQVRQGLHDYIKSLPGMDSETLQLLLDGEFESGNRAVYEHHEWVAMPIKSALDVPEVEFYARLKKEVSNV